jgi:hypothetical protein
MLPLLRPGSLLQEDAQMRRSQAAAGGSNSVGPFLFRNYATDTPVRGAILLVPHTLSGCTIRQFEYRGEAETVGQVIAVAYETGAEWRAAQRSSTIAKAILKFDNRNWTEKESASMGTATR